MMKRRDFLTAMTAAGAALMTTTVQVPRVLPAIVDPWDITGPCDWRWVKEPLLGRIRANIIKDPVMKASLYELQYQIGFGRVLTHDLGVSQRITDCSLANRVESVVDPVDRYPWQILAWRMQHYVARKL